MVPSVGVEPTCRVFQTRALTTLANLAYQSIVKVVDLTGIEPVTFRM